jgi:hypothetical protein
MVGQGRYVDPVVANPLLVGDGTEWFFHGAEYTTVLR